MVVKYLDNGVWGYIDHIRQAANTSYNAEECIKCYDAELKEGDTDYASIVNGVELLPNIVASNKIFMHIADSFEDLDGMCLSTKNLVNIKDAESDIMFPVYAVLLYIEDCKEYDALILVTNQRCYLMNDEGKTIERLV